MKIKPQPAQEKYLSSDADFVLYGGARGGGKTFATLLEPLRHINTPGFNAVIFRRTYPQITNAGGLWDKSSELYPLLGGVPSRAKLQWDFPSGAAISFRHMKLEEHKISWQGLQVCLLSWEELTHFSKSQFLFLLGSNRSTCGVRPYIRATCNPEADSWVRELVNPYLAEDGYVDLNEVGKIKHFIVKDEQFVFVDSQYRDELGLPPKTFTYISADVWDNAALLEKDPGYLQNLMAQNAVDRDRFLGVKGRGGNWLTKASKGKVFRSEWFDILPRIPHSAHIVKRVRAWDFAATVAQSKGDDPDATVGVKMSIDADGLIYIEDVIQQWLTPAGVEKLVTATAENDSIDVAVRFPQDPGQAGIDQAQKYRKLLRGYDAAGVLDSRNKYTRAQPLSRAAEFSEVKLIEGSWNTSFTNELADFPDGKHDDQVDAAAMAYNDLTNEQRRFKLSKVKAA